MVAYIIRRLLIGAIVLILVTFLVFTAMRLLPGDPLLLFIAQNQTQSLTPEQVTELRHEYGLDKSLPVQYIDWMGGVLQGDLGKSILQGQDVKYLISLRLPVTIYLGFLAFLVSVGSPPAVLLLLSWIWG